MEFTLSDAAGIIFLLGFVPYIVKICTDPKVQPSLVTWTIWFLADAVILIGMIINGDPYGLPAGATIGALTVALLSIKYGVAVFEEMDYYVGAGALIGLLSLAFIGETAGIIVSTFVMIGGSWRTFDKTWRDPLSEDPFSWAVYFIAATIGVMAIPTLNWENFGPVGFFIIESVMIILIFVKPRLSANN